MAGKIIHAPYRPSNGTEGELFFAAWCCNCQRDKAMREGVDFDECDDNEKCSIIGDTMAYDVDDPKYPKEWIIDARGHGCCTAFVEAGKEIPVTRCEFTRELPL